METREFNHRIAHKIVAGFDFENHASLMSYQRMETAMTIATRRVFLEASITISETEWMETAKKLLEKGLQKG